MREPNQWQVGDRVQHESKPEWGVGTVLRAEPTTHEGRKAQRLTVRFTRAGEKTLSTAFANLRPADDQPAINRARDAAKAALLGPDVEPEAAATRPARPAPGMMGRSEAPPDEVPIDPVAAREIMSRVPEAARDPFKSVQDRLRATFALYQYKPSGGSLLDWAAVQSGLTDPLSAFSRHDLEVLFERFRINRDQHLATLVLEAKRSGLNEAALLKMAPASMHSVMLDVIRRR